MRRREFITLVGGAAASILQPLGAWSQQRIAHLGVLMVVAENDPDAKRFVAALENQLDAEGWHKGRNLEIAYRWGASNPERLAQYANELVLLTPDILVTLGTAALIPMQKATATIPIVFTVTIIAVTSYALDGEEKAAKAAGCDDYVPKPFSPRQLLAKIRQHLS